MDTEVERYAFMGWPLRLLNEADLLEESRLAVLAAIESASFLDIDKTPAPLDLGELRALPGVLAPGVVERDNMANRGNAGGSH